MQKMTTPAAAAVLGIALTVCSALNPAVGEPPWPRKIAAIKSRQAGQLHPFVVGPAVVDRYMTVVEECGRALLAAR